jgi:hypothetical protein
MNIPFVYIAEETKDGKILLKKKTLNAGEYDIEHLSDGSIALTKYEEVRVSYTDLSRHDFTFSIVKYITIGGVPNYSRKYTTICNDIYCKIGNGTNIVRNSTLNIQTFPIKINGFRYYPCLGISVKRGEEIFSQCMANAIDIDMKIKLANGIIVRVSV